MSRKRSKIGYGKVKAILPYFAVAVVTLMVVALGSLDKQSADINLSLDTFGRDGSEISVDQISELYTVADLSDTLKLASAEDVATNYVSTVTMYGSGQTTAGKLEKPTLTNIDASRGVIEHVLEEGENIDTLAAEYGVSADQIRWSNNLKTADVTPGTTLYIPSTSGIVYTVKAGDTIDSIASKYGSNASEIIAMNDLEMSGIAEGMRVVIKDGSLPETERPEYVAPVVTAPAARAYTYTYLGNTSSRENLVCNGGLGAGQCTTWAWLKRPDLGFIQANANGWASVARAAGYVVNGTPAAGAIFQTSSGWYGHVGYVESVNSDGSINVSERNYAGCWGVLYSTIPASAVGNFNYIH